MSISGHKLYGPKGVGALYVRRRPRVRVEPIQSGGGQERGIRSGTVPTPLAVGLGEKISHQFVISFLIVTEPLSTDHLLNLM